MVSLWRRKLPTNQKHSQGKAIVSEPLAHWRASDQTAQNLDVHWINVGYWAGLFASKIQLGSAGELMGLLHDRDGGELDSLVGELVRSS